MLPELKNIILHQEVLFRQCGSEGIIFKCFSEFIPGEWGEALYLVNCHIIGPTEIDALVLSE